MPTPPTVEDAHTTNRGAHHALLTRAHRATRRTRHIVLRRLCQYSQLLHCILGHTAAKIQKLSDIYPILHYLTTKREGISIDCITFAVKLLQVRIEDKITEQPSRYDHLEKMDAGEILEAINREDRLVAEAVHAVIPQITALVEAIEPRPTVLCRRRNQRAPWRARCQRAATYLWRVARLGGWHNSRWR